MAKTRPLPALEETIVKGWGPEPTQQPEKGVRGEGVKTAMADDSFRTCEGKESRGSSLKEMAE